MLKLLCFSLAALLLLAGPPPAGLAARAYYVAPDGDDDHAGTFSQPFATLRHAATRVKPGDMVYVRGGTYPITTPLWLEPVGAPEARIVFQAYPGEKPILECGGTPADKSCVTISGRYLDFAGFEIRNARRTGLTVWGGAHLRLFHNVIHGSERGGIYVGYDETGPMTDIWINGNVVYNNCQVNNPPSPDAEGGWPSAIGVVRATRVSLTNNRVYENYGEGIILGRLEDGLAANNVVYDNYSVEMYLDGVTRVTYQNNFIYNTGQPAFFRFGQPATGIQLANEAHAESNPLDSIRILNNIVVGGRYGFYYGSYQEGGGLRRTLVANNTFYGGETAQLKIDADDGHRDTLFTHNVFYQAGGRPLLLFDGSPEISFHHNSWYGGSAGAGAGPGDVTADPRLVNPGGLEPGSYRFRPDSPLLDAGRPLDLAYDFWGQPRPAGNGYDLGAYELQR